MVHGSLGGLYIVGSPGLDLDETKNIVVPADQIDLPASSGRAIVSADHHVATLAQVEVGILFALPSDLLVERQILSVYAALRRSDQERGEWLA